MRKILLTLATVFAAFGAFAAEYPVVTSVEELATYSDSTMVLFENIEVTVVKQDMGYYVQETPCLSDGITQIGGNVWPVPAGFTAVGFVHTAENYDGTTYREFYVDSLCTVNKFATLGDLLRFASMEDYVDVLKRSTNVVAESGTAIITSVYEDYAFYYTMVTQGYYTQAMYGVLKYADAGEYMVIGDEITAYGGFKGSIVPTEAVYDEDWNLVSFKGGHYAIDPDVYLYATNWEGAVNIKYTPVSLGDFESGYVYEAQSVRVPAGGTFVEKEGKYYYEAEVVGEQYVEGQGWVNVTTTKSVQVASAYIDLAQYVGKTSEDYLIGVCDKSNIGEETRFLINGFLSSVAEYECIADFLAKGEQYEEEILTAFVNPLLVTYVFKEGYKFIVMVQDETGALAIDFGEAIDSDDEEALSAIKAGDMITGVKGYPQFYASNSSPVIMGATYVYSSGETLAFVPTVESSGNEVKATMTVTVGDMIREWADCQENSTMPEIANNVVSLLDVQVVDTLDEWGYDITYMIQGTDTMELSSLWDADRFNFQTYERNNIVGIADYCRINSNYIYSFLPLSQEHIKDASATPEVTSYEELVANEGVPVIYRGAVIEMISEGYYPSFCICDGQVYVDMSVAGKFDLKGVYQDGGFSVSSVEKVYGFSTIGDLNNYVAMVNPDAAGEAFEILTPMPVSHVEGENVFVYFTGVNDYGGSQRYGTVLQGVKADVKMGDMIQGVKGVSHACDYYMNEDWDYVVNRGAYFEVAEDANITVVSSDNAISYSQATSVMWFISQGYTYGATPIKLEAGSTIIERDGKYYGQEKSEKYYPNPDDPQGEWLSKEVVYEVEFVSTTVDLSQYVGTPTEAVLSGVLDYKNTSADAAVYYVHSAKGINLEYENIAALIAGGGYNVDFISTLLNKVVVTYIHDDGYGDKYMFVQDETAGLYVSFAQSMSTLEGINIGDVIEGLKGQAYWDELAGQAARMGAYDGKWEDYPLNVVATGSEVVPLEVTVAELNAEEYKALNEAVTPAQYANRLVKISNVKLTSGMDVYGEDWPCLVQGTDTLWVPKKFAETWGLEADNEYNIVGVIDFRLLNYSNLYTITPRMASDVQDTSGVVAVESLNNGIYLNAAKQVVADGAVEVVVYDLNGRTVATANAATVDAEGLAQGVYVVRATYADGEVKTAKVVR